MCECCAPVVASDDDRARARLLALLHEVRLVEALALVGRLELLREIVVADAAGVHDRVWGEDVLDMGVCVSALGRRTRVLGTRTAAPRAAFCAAPPAT